MLPSITRPNGTIYRPRKITAEFFVDQDQREEGVVVFGTHDFAVARYEAFKLAGLIGMMAVDPELRWMRRVMRRGDYMFEDYLETGRACVWFKGLVELPAARDFPLPADVPSPQLRGFESYSGSNPPFGTVQHGYPGTTYAPVIAIP